MRQRYYARRGKTLDPVTLLNETGTADMVVGKIAGKANKVVPQNLSYKNGIVVCVLIDKLFYKIILTAVYFLQALTVFVSPLRSSGDV
jgi:hypothetical protein